jgi:hypothetical protein
MVLDFEVMEMPADPGLTLVLFSAEAGTAADDGLRLLRRQVAARTGRQVFEAG